MPFKIGTYQHESGFKVVVRKDNTIYISPDAPRFIRIEDFFDAEKWTKIAE